MKSRSGCSSEGNNDIDVFHEGEKTRRRDGSEREREE